MVMDEQGSPSVADAMMSINTVICIHGIWSHTVAMTMIKRRLAKEYGMKVLSFNYPSIRGTLDENAAALTNFIHKRRLDAAHIIRQLV